MNVSIDKQTGAVRITLSERNLASLVAHGAGGSLVRETAERRLLVVVESDAEHYADRAAEQNAAIGRLTQEIAVEDAREAGRIMADMVIRGLRAH